MVSLGDALPDEIARVTAILGEYTALQSMNLPNVMVGPTIVMIQHDLDRATRALASGDVVEMVAAYQSLKEYEH